jgi:hypothetical protein
VLETILKNIPSSAVNFYVFAVQHTYIVRKIPFPPILSATLRHSLVVGAGRYTFHKTFQIVTQACLTIWEMAENTVLQREMTLQ